MSLELWLQTRDLGHTNSPCEAAWHFPKISIWCVLASENSRGSIWRSRRGSGFYLFPCSSSLFIRRTQRMSVIHAIGSFLKLISVNILIFKESWKVHRRGSIMVTLQTFPVWIRDEVILILRMKNGKNAMADVHRPACWGFFFVETPVSSLGTSVSLESRMDWFRRTKFTVASWNLILHLEFDPLMWYRYLNVIDMPNVQYLRCFLMFFLLF